MKFTITKEQRKHLKSIQWLLGENNRQQGRSLLLAFVYVTEALKGRTIKIIDHAYITTGAGHWANKMLADEIQRIIEMDKIPLKIIWSTLELKRI